MKTFLEHVATDMINRFGCNLSRVAVVFPNKRASLFLDEALMKEGRQTMMSPKYFTITELFRSLSRHNIGDRIKLVCMLYDVFKNVTKTDETLERFYPWGEVMLNDFDDIDKHLLSASRIFTNVSDLHELDSLSYLTDGQKEVLKTFFPNQNTDTSRLKKKFLQLWSKLSDIYTEFSQLQREKNTLCEGSLYRDVVENLDTCTDRLSYDYYLFVGFNHLLPVEEKMFDFLKSHGKALFYWDYDEYYCFDKERNKPADNEAGENILNNLHSYPNALKGTEGLYDNFTKKKDIAILTCATNNIQARYVSSWLKENSRIQKGRKTVIVLSDETLLPSVIHSIPPETGKINITLGYNLAFTTIPSLISKLIADKRYRQADGLMAKVQFLIDSISEESRNAKDIDALQKESLFRTHTLLVRVHRLIKDGYLKIGEQAFLKLFSQLLTSSSVPFHGEPLEGIQIMGVLETRNLDFDDVLLLSCNEGTLPKCSETTSFIPYFLRKAHSLTTIDNKASVYAYYFYRLLQRCSTATLLWNKSTEGMARGEMSRFLLQLLVESPHSIRQLTLRTGQSSTSHSAEMIKKNKEIADALCRRFAKSISPSAINVYLRCQKKFYYQYVLGLEEYVDADGEDNDRRVFGTVFHKAVEELYRPYVNKEITTIALDNIDDKERISLLVKEKYVEALQEFRKQEPGRYKNYEFDGLQDIKISVLVRYIRRLISLDRKLVPFKLLGIELPVRGDFDIRVGNDVLHTHLGGSIDRLDQIRRNGVDIIRVVDYKTGSPKFESKLSSVEDIFDPDKIKHHSDYYLQACLYSCLIADGTTSVQPSLLFIQHYKDEDYNPALCFKQPKQEPEIININDIKSEFLERLHMLTDEIFDIDRPFVAKDPSHSEQGSPCEWCPYRTIC